MELTLDASHPMSWGFWAIKTGNNHWQSRFQMVPGGNPSNKLPRFSVDVPSLKSIPWYMLWDGIVLIHVNLATLRKDFFWWGAMCKNRERSSLQKVKWVWVTIDSASSNTQSYVDDQQRQHPKISAWYELATLLFTPQLGIDVPRHLQYQVQ